MVISSLTFLRPFRQGARGAGALALLLMLSPCPFTSAASPVRPAMKPPAAPAPTLPAPTLAQALAAGKPPVQGVMLAVGAERITLPGKTDVPTDLDPLDIASYGYETDVFGAVSAVAPTTMAVLNGDPAAPDVTSGLRPSDAFQMLAAGLDNAQWRLLTSDRGLGLSDLRDDTQQGLFRALFPQGHLLIAGEDPALENVPDSKRADVQDVSGQIGGARLRLGQTSNIYIHDKAGKTIFFGNGRPDAVGRLSVHYPKHDPNPEEYGVVLRAVVPNAPKPGDLKFAAPALQALVPLAGLKTVADLVYRIGNLTKTEIYPDPHYAGRSVTVIGSAPSVSAADLLRALALCVTGTYRRVGPAFVLTDDLIGVGTRRQRLAEWDARADAAKTRLTDQAGLALLDRRASGARALPSFGDPLALTPDEIKAEHDDQTNPDSPDAYESYPAFDKLTPAQQDWARRIAADYETQRNAGTLPDYLSKFGPAPGAADLTKQVDLKMQQTVQLLLPAISNPIDTGFVYGEPFMLYWPGLVVVERRLHEAILKQSQPEAAVMPPQPPAPSLASVLPLWRRRAVLAHPHTTADVDALVAAMQKIGLNELWLDVFSEGVARVPGSALAPAAPPSGPDILTEALARTKGTGIAVYADLSLLPWGDKPPAVLRDLDIEGQTTREAAIQAYERLPDPKLDNEGNPIPFAPPPVPVSPASPQVQDDLTTLVRALAAQPGLAGLVWEDAKADADLGYTPEMRLSFLRAAHADPVDITPDNGNLRFDVSLPAFDDKAVEGVLTDRWRVARTQANVRLLREMRGAADAAGLPILMEQSDDHIDWLATWDDPKQLPSPLRPLFAGNPYPGARNVIAAARTQGRAVLRRETVKDAGDAGALMRALTYDRKGTAWDGFVLDFTDPATTRGAAPLASLVRAVSAAPAASPQPPATKTDGAK